ncbi:transposase [bacterium]|nr:transposase [bacterium]
MDPIDPIEFDSTAKKLRYFFASRGFIEVPTQHRLSILAACEDPQTIATYSYLGTKWPLPQTGQMWLEHELLRRPDIPGLFCISYSFRAEPNPIPGRHNLTFPMFEFEAKGDMETLRELEIDLVEYLGFGARDSFHDADYAETAERYNTKELEAEHELKLYDEYGPVVLLKDFPQYTSPFWNMKKERDKARKIDVLLHGVETIGSAERGTDPEEMRELFYTISDGMYADILFSQFGRERVEHELEDFLSNDFFPRCGGGIGMTRIIRALNLTKKTT